MLKDTKQQWFKDAKYGLFIHWGLYSILAGEYDGKTTPTIAEWIMNTFDIPVKEYDIHPSMELYTKRYIFWKNWHKEFMNVIANPQETNEKKLMVSLEQEISNLYDMKGMLVDEKGDELQLSIDGVEQVETALRKETLTRGNRVRIIRNMDLLGKEIKGKFSYRVMTGEIRDDFRSQ